MNHHPLPLHNPDLSYPPTKTVLPTLLREYIHDEELCNFLSNKLNKINSFAVFPKHIYSSVPRVKLANTVLPNAVCAVCIYRGNGFKFVSPRVTKLYIFRPARFPN